MNSERIIQQLKRVHVYLTDNSIEVLVELFVIGLLVLLVLRFLRGTRGARAIKGVMLVLVIATLTINTFGGEQALTRLQYLYNHILEVVTLSLIIVFQPELRRALVRLGEARFFRGGARLRRARVIEEVLDSLAYLSKNKIGGIIAIERQVGFGALVDLGTRVDAVVSRALLNTIFWPGSALHDMGVVIRGDRVVAAGVQFPLAEGEHISQELGSRHRAAIGLAQETDAFVLVVSEETGIISIAERGELTREMSIPDVRRRLVEGLEQTQMPPESEVESERAKNPAE